jgi:hypothetical protein
MQSCDFTGRTCENTSTHVWSEVCTTNDLFNTVFKVCVFPLLNVVRNRTKIAPWSLPMILFVRSTVCSLVIFRMSWFPPGSVLNSWSSWLWNSSPFPPASLTFLCWMKFVVELYTCLDTGLGRKRKKLDGFVSKNFRVGFFGVLHPRSFSLHLLSFLLQTCTLSVLLGSSHAVR